MSEDRNTFTLPFVIDDNSSISGKITIPQNATLEDLKREIALSAGKSDSDDLILFFQEHSSSSTAALDRGPIPDSIQMPDLFKKLAGNSVIVQICPDFDNQTREPSGLKRFAPMQARDVSPELVTQIVGKDLITKKQPGDPFPKPKSSKRQAGFTSISSILSGSASTQHRGLSSPSASPPPQINQLPIPSTVLNPYFERANRRYEQSSTELLSLTRLKAQPLQQLSGEHAKVITKAKQTRDGRSDKKNQPEAALQQLTEAFLESIDPKNYIIVDTKDTPLLEHPDGGTMVKPDEVWVKNGAAMADGKPLTKDICVIVEYKETDNPCSQLLSYLEYLMEAQPWRYSFFGIGINEKRIILMRVTRGPTHKLESQDFPALADPDLVKKILVELVRADPTFFGYDYSFNSLIPRQFVSSCLNPDPSSQQSVSSCSRSAFLQKMQHYEDLAHKAQAEMDLIPDTMPETVDKIYAMVGVSNSPHTSASASAASSASAPAASSSFGERELSETVTLSNEPPNYIAAGASGWVSGPLFDHCVVKRFYPLRSTDYHQERNSLKAFESASIPGVPRLLAHENRTLKLLICPLGKHVVSADLNPSRVWALITTLISVHRREILHRDVRPSNMIIFSGRIYLLDWAFSVSMQLPQAEATYPFAGTLHYASSRLLTELIECPYSPETHYYPEDDLCSLMKALYILKSPDAEDLRMINVPRHTGGNYLYELKKCLQEVLNWWDQVENPSWKHLFSLAEKYDVEQLSAFFLSKEAKTIFIR